ncbi:hypothetical protein SAMN05216218_11024 [Halorientalis regularis]|jgi:hypothetical protein|uniref:Uncharacterized protein n=1 Tax=Halorientalis regularis TaxID=660518 RepID=A0A1G7P8X5_9EURY|nr:hypothetical protein SAMN05216218_11024 [Halorientalis regularis]
MRDLRSALLTEKRSIKKAERADGALRTTTVPAQRPPRTATAAEPVMRPPRGPVVERDSVARRRALGDGIANRLSTLPWKCEPNDQNALLGKGGDVG